MKVVIIQPPLVQLNCPYPSGAYLSAFFKNLGFETSWSDLSNQLFHSIFSKSGLTQLFDLTEKKALKMAASAEKQGDENTAFNIRRYVSSKELWINWIDQIKAILCEGNSNGSQISGREISHRFLFSPYTPRGNRMENFLASMESEPTVDDCRFLASLALADLADYITAVFDRNFSLIRYAESVSTEEKDFAQILKELDSPVLKTFYQPILETLYNQIIEETTESEKGGANIAGDRPRKVSEITGEIAGDRPQKNQPINKDSFAPDFLILISMPFAGTYIPGLYTARFLKQLLKNRAFICIGGGFANTELRELKDSALCDFIDAISYDRGYGSYAELLAKWGLSPIENAFSDFSGFSGNDRFYKLRLFSEKGISTPDCMDLKKCPEKERELHKAAIQFELKTTQKTVPDYSDIDFSRYPRVCDDKNPMHRLWNDGTWIKAYLAHGCYWHQCAFCDVNLDYVCGYKPADTNALFSGLLETARSKGVYGIHFVDEALPPVQLRQFALKNIQNDSQLFYWGNVRFEKTFTRDLADFLAFGGFGGVSAGIEIATGKGLDAIHKGTDLDSIVSACAAFKEAGILVHSYMIYGFWLETPVDLMNSMETLRQFFEQGLLDSAFWHKFTLTKNSRIYSEWQKGLHKELKPFEKKDGLHFEGERDSEKYGPGLDAALNSWMHGEKLDMNIRRWFDFPVPAPTIPKDYIEKAIERYEQKKEKAFRKKIADTDLDYLFWIGTNLFMSNGHLCWFYMQNMEEVAVPKQLSGESSDLIKNIEALRVLKTQAGHSEETIKYWTSSQDRLSFLGQLRGRGVCSIKL